jgi:hypothetical protein
MLILLYNSRRVNGRAGEVRGANDIKMRAASAKFHAPAAGVSARLYNKRIEQG